VSVTLFAHSYLDTEPTLVATTPGGTNELIARLFDRDNGPVWTGEPELTAIRDIAPLSLAWNTPTEYVIKIDLGSNLPVTGIGFVNHNLTGITVTVKADTTTPPTTTRDTFSATGVDVLRTFATLSLRYWWITMPAMASPPTIAEILFGLPAVITENPHFEQAGLATLGNVRRDRSPAGKPFTTKRGVSRGRLQWGWNGIADANRVLIEGAFADCDDGAKDIQVKDHVGALRWMSFTSEAIEPTPKAGALGLNELTIELEDSPA
jgi:hypothetical protein